MLHCWGSGSSGQLGLGRKGATEPGIPFRRGPDAGREVVQVACGERHTLFLRAGGGVFSCGDNTQGQLGRRTRAPGEQRCYVPEQVCSDLQSLAVTWVSCGKSHSLAVCSNGKVFSWGAGDLGQLGTEELKDCFIPKNIAGLSTHKIIQVACGHYHSVALAKDGRFFSWGQNTHGQLGIGKDVAVQASPRQVLSLHGIPLAQVAAGGAHSFALSVSGVVYGWGRNNTDQLGLTMSKPVEQIFKPHSIGALRCLDVIYVSCGDEHTAVLTKNGSVYTFGDNSAGQLGHSSSTNKSGPQKVGGIDAPVSHLACGR
uniref:RCC1-like domain-containing protein n=1 Tax=Salvator merianae TaxID=96440 RepID=A0A8D0C2P8_SALMN